MADADVDRLAHRVMGLVERDTVDGVSSLRPGQRLELDDAEARSLQLLARNLDVPARLAPRPYRVANNRDPKWYDLRADARRGLTALVARCADALEPDRSLPRPVDAEARERLATAVTRAYAANATPRLVAGLFPNGRPDDLGLFDPPQLEGDVAAARAMAIAIGARTAAREEDVLRKLVAEGHGGAAYAAAGMLLEDRPDYQRLPAEQQPGVRRHLARSIEAGFATRDLREAKQREFTEELENRREDVTGGAGTIDKASGMATEELGKLNAFLDDIDYWQRSAEPELDEVRGIVAEHLVSRVEHHAGIQTDLTTAQLKSPTAATTAAAQTMVTASSVPAENRPAAAAATATMLTEGFDELPTLITNWQAVGSNVGRQAQLYGNTLGDRTLAAVRTFERQPPNPSTPNQEQAATAGPAAVADPAAFAADPAIPPLRRVHSGEAHRADEGAVRPRSGGTDGLTR